MRKKLIEDLERLTDLEAATAKAEKAYKKNQKSKKAISEYDRAQSEEFEVYLQVLNGVIAVFKLPKPIAGNMIRDKRDYLIDTLSL